MSKHEITFVQLAGGSACNECGALVPTNAHWLSVHESWHWRVSAVLRSVEYADALAAELRERGDG